MQCTIFLVVDDNVVHYGFLYRLLHKLLLALSKQIVICEGMNWRIEFGFGHRL